jgi:hypothetical protein
VEGVEIKLQDMGKLSNILVPSSDNILELRTDVAVVLKQIAED